MKEHKFLISFSGTQFKEATAILPDDKEDVFYGLGFEYTTGSKTRFLIRQVLNPYEFEVNRGIAHVSPSPEFTCKLYNLIRREKASLVLNIHWHKFEEYPAFSFKDDEVAFWLRGDIRQMNLDVKVLQVVFGNRSKHFKARLLTDNGFFYFDNIEIVGPNGITVLPERKPAYANIGQVFEKNALAFTKEGMEKISHTIVTVIGAGGIGSGLLYQMARIGFKYINIIDPDVVTANNCNRLYWVNNPRDVIGKSKVRFIAEEYKRFNPRARIWHFTGDAKSSKARRLMKRADLIVLAVDNNSIRAVVNSFAAQYCKPLVNVSTGIFMNKEGDKIQNAGTQIQWLIPREIDYPCLRCQGSLSQKEIQQELMDESQKQNRRKAGYIDNTLISPEPQVMPLNGIGISLAMWQICCWITGIRKPEPWTYYDAIQNELINMQVRQSPECTCCGLNEMSVLALGDYKKELIKQ
ncbi:MAG: ThiF family adenylyltransferase [Candidatus Omnitrophota bacterium]|nr:ThiF family adenylyltransferase [Candidatus Omnitrophota bacterium]